MEKANNVDDYIQLQKTAIAQNPECGNSHYNLAVALIGKKQYDEAQNELYEAIENSPNLAEAYVQLGGLCLQRGDMEGGTSALSTPVPGLPKGMPTLVSCTCRWAMWTKPFPLWRRQYDGIPVFYRPMQPWPTPI